MCFVYVFACGLGTSATVSSGVCQEIMFWGGLAPESPVMLKAGCVALLPAETIAKPSSIFRTVPWGVHKDTYAIVLKHIICYML